MIPITEQIVITFITVCLAPTLLAVISIFAVWSKNRAVARLKRSEAENENLKADAAQTEAEAEKIKAEAAVIRTEAEARLRETEADAKIRMAIVDQTRRQAEMMDKQLRNNEQQLELFRQQRMSNEEGYSTIRGVQEDMNRQLTNMYNAIRELKVETLNAKAETLQLLHDLPGMMHTTGGSMLEGFAKTLAGEMAIAITEQFERQRIDTSMYPFPDPDDPDWREEMVYPIVSDVIIHKEPRLWDNAKLQKPCAKINAIGERLRVITQRSSKWVIVDKIASGERCWGWLPVWQVQVGEAEKQPT